MLGPGLEEERELESGERATNQSTPKPLAARRPNKIPLTLALYLLLILVPRAHTKDNSRHHPRFPKKLQDEGSRRVRKC